MHAEDLVVDNGSNSQVVKHLSKRPPDIERPILSDAFIIEAIDLGDEAGLVVAPQQSYPVSVPHLQCQQHQEGLDAVSPSVHIVPEEDIVSVGWVAPNFKKLQKVVQLSVDISANGDR